MGTEYRICSHRVLFIFGEMKPMEIQVRHDPAGPQALAFAAAELKDYLDRMLAEDAGVWPAVLTVRSDGPTGPDRFSVRLTPDEGHITGSNGRAVLLGAYDLLRRLGCRFLAPGRENELVPEIRREALALDYEHQASFHHRGVCIEGADSRENVLDFIDWLPKVGFILHQPFNRHDCLRTGDGPKESKRRPPAVKTIASKVRANPEWLFSTGNAVDTGCTTRNPYRRIKGGY